MKKTALFFLLLFFSTAYPCMNEYEEVYGVDHHDSEPNGTLSDSYVDEGGVYSYIAANLYLLDEMPKEASDLAVAYVYIKKYKRALDITTRLVAKFPGEYNVVITHAVCLELNGKPEEALGYLRKAMLINPRSHWGSEWIHEKILEFVISKENIQGRSVLGLDFGNDSIPHLKNDLNADTLLTHLEYQLEDRGAFVDTTDPLYGSLLFDYANLLLMQNEFYNAHYEFERVQNFGYTHPALQKRIDYCQALIDQKSKQRDYDYYRIVESGTPQQYQRYALLGLSLLVILASASAFLVILLRRK